MQFEIESAGIADRFALVITAPQGGRRRSAISAPQAQTSRGRLKMRRKQSKETNEDQIIWCVMKCTSTKRRISLSDKPAVFVGCAQHVAVVADNQIRALFTDYCN